MSSLKVFVASSERCHDLAEALQLRFAGETARLSIIPWMADTKKNNASLLETLRQHADECDLAVIFLTRDFDSRSRLDKEPAVLPSPNCSFELGLFMGALGDPTRCLIFSTLRDRFADLRGQILPTFIEPDTEDEWRAGAWRKPIIDAAEEAIRDCIKKGARSAYRVAAISVEDLFHNEGNRKYVPRDTSVLIRAAQPAEQNVKYARIVLDNFRFAVAYHYLFDLDTANFNEIGVMLRSLVLAGLPGDATRLENADDDELRAIMSLHAGYMPDVIDKWRELYIHFVPHEAYDEFCIHNCMGTRGNRLGYLKWAPDRFVVMPSDRIAQRVKYYGGFADLNQHRVSIFSEGQLKGERDALEAAILEKFPKVLYGQIAHACFGLGEMSISPS